MGGCFRFRFQCRFCFCWNTFIAIRCEGCCFDIHFNDMLIACSSGGWLLGEQSTSLTRSFIHPFDWLWVIYLSIQSISIKRYKSWWRQSSEWSFILPAFGHNYWWQQITPGHRFDYSLIIAAMGDSHRVRYLRKVRTLYISNGPVESDPEIIHSKYNNILIPPFVL